MADEDSTVKLEVQEDTKPEVQGRGGSLMDTKLKGKRGGTFDEAPVVQDAEPGAPAKSVEGWVVIALNLHEDTKEEDVQDFFVDYGSVRIVRVMTDHKTTRCIGHAFVEFAEAAAAQAAIEQGNGKPFLGGLPISISWAFVVPQIEVKKDDEKKSTKRGADDATEAPAAEAIDEDAEPAMKRERGEDE